MLLPAHEKYMTYFWTEEVFDSMMGDAGNNSIKLSLKIQLSVIKRRKRGADATLNNDGS